MYHLKEIRNAFLREALCACGPFPETVRKRQPLVHLLTNYVTVTDCVNAVLAVGGRAICSHALQETAQVTSGADALVCNLGGTEYYEAMERSAEAAMRKGIPLVIDPVGCAASDHRLQMCLHLVKAYQPAAIRGNYAEIAALTDTADSDASAAGASSSAGPERVPVRSGSAGLDSTSDLTSGETAQLAAHMTAFARRYHTILIASGAVDLCTDGVQLIEVAAGTPALKRMTGAGCLSTAVLAAFLAADETGRPQQTFGLSEGSGAAGIHTEHADSGQLASAAAAVRYVGLAGEYALHACCQTGTGAGHFHMYLMDLLSAGDEVWADGTDRPVE